MTKRRLALMFLAAVLALLAAAVAVLRTRWAGEKLCGLTAARIASATGLEVATRGCHVEPLTLTVVVEGLRLGPEAAPLFTADEASLRVAVIQGLGRRFEVAGLTLRRPRLVATVPARAGKPAACPPPELDLVDLDRVEVRDGSLDLELQGRGRVKAEGLTLDVSRAARSRWRFGGAWRRSRVAASAATVALDLGGRSLQVVSPSVEGEVALDLSEVTVTRADLKVGGARLGLRGLVRTLCTPVLDVTATVEGSLAELVALAGESSKDWDARLKVELKAKGRPAAPELSASVDFTGLGAGSIRLGEGHADAHLRGDTVVVDRLRLPFSTGQLLARGEVKLDPTVPIDATAEFDDTDLAEVLEKLGITGAWITAPMKGTGRIAGQVWPPRLQVSVDAQVTNFKVLEGSWRKRRPGDPTIVEFARGRVVAPFRIALDGLTFEKARVEVGRGTTEIDADVRFDHQAGFQVRASGSVDLDALGHIASLPWGGLAAVSARIGAAPYGLPSAEARLRVEGFRFLEVDLGTVSGEIAHAGDYVLRFSNVEAQRPASTSRGWLAVDLGARPVRLVGSRFTSSGRARDYLEAVTDWLPSSRALKGLVDGRIEAMTVQAAGPASAPDVQFEGRFGEGEVAGRRFESGRVAGTIRSAAEARFERLELRSGPGTVSATGTWAFQAPQPWALELTAAGVPAAALGLPGGEWGGSVSGSATLGGSWEQPDARFALNGDAVSLRGSSLGTVQLGGTIGARRLLLTGGAEGMRFSGEARLEGRYPYQAQAQLKLEDAARLWPGGPPAGFRATVDGLATASGELAEPRTARGQIELMRLSTGFADFRVENAEPVRLAFDQGRLEIESFKIRGVNTEFSVTGGLGGNQALDLEATGALDLRLLSGVLPAMRRPHGRLVVEAHVGGSGAALELLGDGRLEDGGFQVKNTNAVFDGLNGALSFSQNRVLAERLEGQINGGKVVMSGEVELERLTPARLRLDAQLESVPVAIPAYLPITVSGRVEAAGTPEETLVTGRLHVLQARYTTNVDLEKGLLEFRKRRSAAARSYDKAAEWLRFDLQLAVDGDARIDNDLVRGGVKGELTLTGSLAAPGIVGALSMTEGSRALFRGNDFQLTHAVIDFTERNRVEMALDVHGEARVQDYQVFMHVFGSLAEPKLALTASPALSQPDIITLLSMGYTSRDSQAGKDSPGGQQGVQSAATAAAAQALISASGLDEQVRRFVPRGEVLQDLSVRVTSARSEVNNQVEPRAEFESWLVRDKLKLRFQAPLSGGRGQKAQAELRLGSHTAIQYQWDNDNPEAKAGDHGLDLRLRWEWEE